MDLIRDPRFWRCISSPAGLVSKPPCAVGAVGIQQLVTVNAGLL